LQYSKVACTLASNILNIWVLKIAMASVSETTLSRYIRPSLSIGLPVYNAAPYLTHCLQSIFAQTWTDWELIVVDDGSNDASVSILQTIVDPRVRIFSHGQRRGLAACLNKITAEAHGKYVARMDADDLMHPERLERQLLFLDRHPEMDGLGCGLAILERNLHPVGCRLLPPRHEAICSRPLRGFQIAHATYLGRTAWFRNNPYNESNRGCEDWELWASTFRRSQFANLNEPLYFYRELDSFSLSKYLRKKAVFAAHLWAHRREFGFPKTAGEVVRQYAHMLLYAGASVLGATDRLLLARNQAFPENAEEFVLEGLQRVQGVKLPTAAGSLKQTH